MAKPDDISSTEKLLEIIRQGQTDSIVEKVAPATNKPAVPAQTEAPQSKPQPSSPAATTPTDIPSPTRSLAPSQKGKTGGGLAILLTSRKRSVVGIHFQTDGMALVWLTASGQRSAVERASFLPFDLEAPLPENEFLATLLKALWFPAFLKSAVDDFCGPDDRTALWCALPRQAVETHNITIPKVPAKELENTVFWSTQKQAPFDGDNILLDFEIVREFETEGATKVHTLVYLTARHEVEDLKQCFSEAGHPLTGLSSPSAAFINELRTNGQAKKEESLAHLFLGHEKSFIALFHQGKMVFRREVNTGASSFVDSLMGIASGQGIILNETECGELLFGDQAATNASLTAKGLLEEGQDLFDIEMPAAVRLVRQMERTIDYCVKNLSLPRANKILLAGLPFSSNGLAAYFTAETGLQCQVHIPAPLANRDRMPTATKEESGHRLVTAYGMALSDKVTTQNFLLTQRQKAQARQVKRINGAIVGVTVALLLLCLGFFTLQNSRIHTQQDQLADITRLIEQLPVSDPQQAANQLLAGMHIVQQGRQSRAFLAQRFFPIALISEVTANLPKHVDLLKLTLTPPKRPGNIAKQQSIALSLRGVISGSPLLMEFQLATLLRTMTDSALIHSARLTNKDKGIYKGEEVLHFTVDILAEHLFDQPKGGKS